MFPVLPPFEAGGGNGIQGFSYLGSSMYSSDSSVSSIYSDSSDDSCARPTTSGTLTASPENLSFNFHISDIYHLNSGGCTLVIPKSYAIASKIRRLAFPSPYGLEALDILLYSSEFSKSTDAASNTSSSFVGMKSISETPFLERFFEKVHSGSVPEFPSALKLKNA